MVSQYLAILNTYGFKTIEMVPGATDPADPQPEGRVE